MKTATSDVLIEMTEPDLPRALERSRQRWVALFDEPEHILDNHNRVIYHEADGNGDRHQ